MRKRKSHRRPLQRVRMIHGGSLSDHQPVGIHRPREDSSLTADRLRAHLGPEQSIYQAVWCEDPPGAQGLRQRRQTCDARNVGRCQPFTWQKLSGLIDGKDANMRSLFVALAVGCALIASDSVSQTFRSTSLQAFPFRVPQPADINPNPTSRMTVSTEQTDLLLAPNANATALGTIGFGTKVTVMSTAGGWSHVNFGGKDGYISSQSLK